MWWLIIIFMILEVFIASHFYNLGQNFIIKEFEDAGILCNEWYKLTEKTRD